MFAWVRTADLPVFPIFRVSSQLFLAENRDLKSLDIWDQVFLKMQAGEILSLDYVVWHRQPWGMCLAQVLESRISIAMNFSCIFHALRFFQKCNGTATEINSEKIPVDVGAIPLWLPKVPLSGKMCGESYEFFFELQPRWHLMLKWLLIKLILKVPIKPKISDCSSWLKVFPSCQKCRRRLKWKLLRSPSS